MDATLMLTDKGKIIARERRHRGTDPADSYRSLLAIGIIGAIGALVADLARGAYLKLEPTKRAEVLHKAGVIPEPLLKL